MANAIIFLIRLTIWVVCTLAWAIVGLLYWLPFLARVMALYVGAVVAATLTGRSVTAAERALQIAAGLYVSGFERVLRVLRPEARSAPYPEIGGRDVIMALWHTAYTVAFWCAVAWLLDMQP